MNKQIKINKPENKEEYCPKLNLSGWNLNEKEIKVLMLLNRITFLNAEDTCIFKEFGIDESEIMSILETLIEKGLVSRKGKKK